MFLINKSNVFLLVALSIIMMLLSAFDVEKSASVFESKSRMQLDSLTDSIEVIDTIATYDPNDYTEKIVIVKRKVPRIAPTEKAGFNIDDIVFSGKTISKKDSMVTYNPVTKEETLMITSYDMPIELDEPMKTMNVKEITKLKIKYATNKKNETKTAKRKK